MLGTAVQPHQSNYTCCCRCQQAASLPLATAVMAAPLNGRTHKSAARFVYIYIIRNGCVGRSWVFCFQDISAVSSRELSFNIWSVKWVRWQVKMLCTSWSHRSGGRCSLPRPRGRHHGSVSGADCLQQRIVGQGHGLCLCETSTELRRRREGGEEREGRRAGET